MRVGRKKRTKGPDTANKLPQGEYIIHVYTKKCRIYEAKQGRVTIIASIINPIKSKM